MKVEKLKADEQCDMCMMHDDLVVLILVVFFLLLGFRR